MGFRVSENSFIWGDTKKMLLARPLSIPRIRIFAKAKIHIRGENGKTKFCPRLINALNAFIRRGRKCSEEKGHLCAVKGSVFGRRRRRRRRRRHRLVWPNWPQKRKLRLKLNYQGC